MKLTLNVKQTYFTYYLQGFPLTVRSNKQFLTSLKNSLIFDKMRLFTSIYCGLGNLGLLTIFFKQFFSKGGMIVQHL